MGTSTFRFLRQLCSVYCTDQSDFRVWETKLIHSLCDTREHPFSSIGLVEGQRAVCPDSGLFLSIEYFQSQVFAPSPFSLIPYVRLAALHMSQLPLTSKSIHTSPRDCFICRKSDISTSITVERREVFSSRSQFMVLTWQGRYHDHKTFHTARLILHLKCAELCKSENLTA